MTVMNTLTVGKLEIANDKPFVLIAGPCAMESRAHAFEMAEALNTICQELGMGLIFKSSFDKGNRTSISSPPRDRDGQGA
jgi:2-dehydro-3-deoxyphosphooctonate aldolase (KDO 8-P synthase)